MKTRKITCLLPSVILVITLLLSCNTDNDLNSPETLTYTNESSSVFTTTPTSLQSVTATIIPTITYTIFPQTSTATPDPNTPLPDDKEIEIVNNIFQKDDNCRFPCFWDVIPGETPWEEVKRRIWDIGGSYGTFYKGKTTIYGLGGGLDSLIIKFFVSDGVVTYIYFESEGNNQMLHFQKAMDYYSPQDIMDQYGIPSRVWLLTVNISRGDLHGYQLWLVYDNDGFIVEYDGYLEERENDLKWCPRYENGEDIDGVKIFTQEIHNSEPLEEIAKLNDSDYFKERKRSLGEATGLSTQEFYNLFQPGGEGCFITPNNIWEY